MIEIGEEARTILDEMVKVKRPEGLTHYGNYSLRSFMESQVLSGVDKCLDEKKKVVIIVVGEPDSGKTYWLKKINRLLISVFPQLAQEGGLTTVFFEYGLRKLSELGLLTTSPRDLRKDEEIEAASKLIVPRMVEARRRNQVTTSEFPFISTLIINDRLEGLDAGASTVYPLLNGDPPFDDIESENFFIGLIGGSDMKKEGEEYRTQMKRTTTLKERQQVAFLHGRPMPQTEEEGELMFLEGASAATILRFQRQIGELSDVVRKRGVDVRSPIRYSSKELKQEVRVFKSIRNHTLARSPKISLENIFIGYNNPDWKDLPKPTSEELKTLLFDSIAKAADRLD